MWQRAGSNGKKAEADLRRNVAIHNRLARRYESIHGEIFNEVEQARLHSLLEKAAAAIDDPREPLEALEALDMGCGSGNLTGHLLRLGAKVTAADVAGEFLDLVRRRYPDSPIRTHRLNGRDLSGIASGAYDMVATYSVLHHIPDYLLACREMARVCRKGGVVVIDHEPSPNMWQQDQELARFRRKAERFDWRKYARPANYVHRARRLFDPKYSNEGDIHVWPDDHVEWAAVAATMRESGCEIV